MGTVIGIALGVLAGGFVSAVGSFCVFCVAESLHYVDARSRFADLQSRMGKRL